MLDFNKKKRKKKVLVTEPGKSPSYILGKRSILTKNHVVDFVNGTLSNYRLT